MGNSLLKRRQKNRFVMNLKPCVLAMLMQSSATTVYWIGGNDRDTDSGWHWSDGSPFAFFYWQHGKIHNNLNRCIYCYKLYYNKKLKTLF